MKMVGSAIGEVIGKSPVSGEWAPPEEFKPWEGPGQNGWTWQGKDVFIPGWGVHVEPNPKAEWGAGYRIEMPGGTYSATFPITLDAKQAQTAYQLRTPGGGGAGEEYWFRGLTSGTAPRLAGWRHSTSGA